MLVQLCQSRRPTGVHTFGTSTPNGTTPCGGLKRPKSAYLCRGGALYRLLRELMVLSVLYEAMLVPLDAKLGLYVKESVSAKESVSGISSVAEAVILISSN